MSRGGRGDSDSLDDLVLELSLAAALPVGAQGRNYILATSAANVFSLKAKELPPSTVKSLSHGIQPLLTLLWNDIDHPCAGKAALSLRSLMASRSCILEFIDLNGIEVVSKIFQKLLNGKKPDLVTQSTHRTIVEHCAACYREIGRYYPWKIVRAGALRQTVSILRYGDMALKTIAAGILAVCSVDLEICKLLFTNGCVKPLIDVALEPLTNEACILAAVGSLTQLCQVPEIAARVFGQGVLPLLERSIHQSNCLAAAEIREKSLNCLHWLSRVESIQSKIPSDQILAGMSRELKTGTIQAQLTVIQMMLKLHNKYPASEENFVTEHIEEIRTLLGTAPWSTRNLCAKCICVLYRSHSNQMYLMERGVIDSLLTVMREKNDELQEAPLVAILSLLSHPDIPKMFLAIPGALDSIVRLMMSNDEIIRSLAVVVLKALRVFDIPRINGVIPESRRYLMDQEDNIPQRVGEEYGGLVEEYLQIIVENRREQHYLLDQLTPEDWKAYGMNKKEIQPYQDTFMELDPTCKGTLDIDELKVVMVTLGYLLDEDELQQLLDDFDKEKKGYLDFRDFMYMILDWNTKFGEGVARLYNTATKRGPLGRARRHLSRWLNKNQTQREEVDAAKEKRYREVEERKNLAAEHWEGERIRKQREQEKKRNTAFLALRSPPGGDT